MNYENFFFCFLRNRLKGSNQKEKKNSVIYGKPVKKWDCEKKGRGGEGQSFLPQKSEKKFSPHEQKEKEEIVSLSKQFRPLLLLCSSR